MYDEKVHRGSLLRHPPPPPQEAVYIYTTLPSLSKKKDTSLLPYFVLIFGEVITIMR